MKCKHLNTIEKFNLAKKYDEDISIRYTFCKDCNVILKGGVSFITLEKFKKVNRTKKVKNPKLKSQPKDLIQAQVEQTPEITESAKINPPEKKKPREIDLVKTTSRMPNDSKPLCGNLAGFVKQALTKPTSKYKEVDADELESVDDLDIFLK